VTGSSLNDQQTDSLCVGMLEVALGSSDVIVRRRRSATTATHVREVWWRCSSFNRDCSFAHTNTCNKDRALYLKRRVRYHLREKHASQTACTYAVKRTTATATMKYAHQGIRERLRGSHDCTSLTTHGKIGGRGLAGEMHASLVAQFRLGKTKSSESTTAHCRSVEQSSSRRQVDEPVSMTPCHGRPQNAEMAPLRRKPGARHVVLRHIGVTNQRPRLTSQCRYHRTRSAIHRVAPMPELHSTKARNRSDQWRET